MERTTITDKFVLVETEDIDFSILRLAVEEYYSILDNDIIITAVDLELADNLLKDLKTL